MNPPPPHLPYRSTPWLQDIGLGLIVLILGVAEAIRGNGSGYSLDQLAIKSLLVLVVSAGVALYRQAPGFALLMMWAAAGVHVLAGAPIMLVEAAAAVVAFGTARYGSTAILWLSGFSIPIGSLIVLYFEGITGLDLLSSILGSRYLPPLPRLYIGWATPTFLALFLVWMLLLVVPWMTGLVLRSRAATRRSQTDQAIAEQERAVAEAARDQASEIARLRAQQVQLANDVHDVVGHSLTVILAQAESAQFLPADDRDRIRQTLDNIAASARQSLGDVRQVLSSTAGRSATGQTASLDSLIDGVRAAGNTVRSTVAGTPQPLPPDLDAVAFRVLQEMLTNALKHGRRGEPLDVERHWQGELRIEVSNTMSSPPPASASASSADDRAGYRADHRADDWADDWADHRAGYRAGQDATGPRPEPLGLEGMRRRLESVGGRLDVRHRGQAGEATFTVTAWIPLRPITHV